MPKAISPLGSDWPGVALAVMPGDLSRYVPEGVEIAPNWTFVESKDNVVTVNVAGFEPRELDPVLGAPPTRERGGTIYFQADIASDKLRPTLEIMGIALDETRFAVFGASSRSPLQERYADMVRIVSRRALMHLFKPGKALEDLADPGCTVADYIGQFLGEQRKKWQTPEYGLTPKMEGMFGGDGEDVRELLCFGLMVENSYWDIYRIWSRACLVSK